MSLGYVYMMLSLYVISGGLLYQQWPTDCQSVNGSDGMVVAIRNGHTNSYIIVHVKCQSFPQSPGQLKLDKAADPVVLAFRANVGNTVRCPENHVGFTYMLGSTKC
jgi:hypothetical protein